MILAAFFIFAALGQLTLRNERCGRDYSHGAHEWPEGDERHVCDGGVDLFCRLGFEFCNRPAEPGELCAFHKSMPEPSHRRSGREDRLAGYRAQAKS